MNKHKSQTFRVVRFETLEDELNGWIFLPKREGSVGHTSDSDTAWTGHGDIPYWTVQTPSYQTKQSSLESVTPIHLAAVKQHTYCSLNRRSQCKSHRFDHMDDILLQRFFTLSPRLVQADSHHNNWATSPINAMYVTLSHSHLRQEVISSFLFTCAGLVLSLLEGM